MEDFAALLMLKDEVWRLNNDHLKMRLLLLRINEDRKLLDFMPASSAEYAAAKARIVRSTAEIIRRLSVAIAVFTFTLMGTAFGMTITRTRNARSVILVVGLAALYLVAFFMAKGWSNHLLLASALYTLPHVCIIGCSFRVLSRISRGVI
jgi:lipopolysaccharide export system permease protein